MQKPAGVLFASLSMCYLFQEKKVKKSFQKPLTIQFNPVSLQHIN